MVKTIGLRLIDHEFESRPSHIFFSPKRNKNLNENVMNWRGRILCQLSSKSQPNTNILLVHVLSYDKLGFKKYAKISGYAE